MNERIRQLAEQAHEYSYSEYTKRLEMERADQIYFYDIFNQKFAQLIVQEVINIAEHTKNYNRTIYTTHDVDRAKALMADLIKSIKQQLG